MALAFTLSCVVLFSFNLLFTVVLWWLAAEKQLFSDSEQTAHFLAALTHSVMLLVAFVSGIAYAFS